MILWQSYSSDGMYDVDDAHAARRRYKKDLDLLKPDIVAYNKQKEVAMGLAPGTLVKSAGGSALDNFDPTAGSSSAVQVRLSIMRVDLLKLKFGCVHI